MRQFIEHHRDKILGTLSGFDRIRFRGTLRVLSYVGGMMNYLWHARVKLKEFGKSVDSVTQRTRHAVEQAANERYLQALAHVDQPSPLGDMTKAICRPTRWKGKRVRALNPFAADDFALLEAVARGDFTLNGFRNRDLRQLLYSTRSATAEKVRRQSSMVTRKLRLLRAHHLIKKVPKTHRYQLTAHGQAVIATILAAKDADVSKLTAAA